MYLRSLRIKGFKSFPRQTELVFEPGVAVIIGPNGSGKSNVSDAITWVLGEQSPSTIRGTSMQDVIFAGSDGRRASGSAEVELTFDNGDGALSVPTPEVSIGRRVQRGGETTYLINRAPCRLADVLELTAEMGLGRELHAIVGQGRVESLLASKPVERRALIEEAAGLGVYKRRRERAEIKLREVRRNLERARDLEKEAASQLAPLRRQANAAELRRSVEREIAEARGSLLTGELEAVDARLAASRAAIEQVAVEKDEADARLAAIETERLADEETFTRDLQEREQRAARALRARYLADRLASTRRLIEQRLQLAGELERAALTEREGLTADAQGALVDPSDGGDARSAATSLDTFEEALAAAEAAHEEASGALAAAQAGAAAARSQAAAADLDREAVEARLARLRDRRAALSDELERAASESGAAAGALEEAAGAVALAQQRAEGAGIAGGDAEAAALASDEESAAALRALEEAEASVRSVIAERAAAETELEHAEAALRELRDVGDDVLQVMEQHPGATALTSALSCEPGYEAALGAALAQFPGAVAVGSGVDQWGLLSALRTAGVRLVRLVLARPRSADTGGFPGAVRLLDKVSVEGDAGLEGLLADVVIVDDLRALPDSFTGLAVTRDGAYYRPATGQLGLAAGLPAAVLVERRAKTAGLRERLDALKAREARGVAAAARARASADALAAARAAAAETLAAARREAAEAGHALTRAQAEERIAAERRERLSRTVEAGEGELAARDGDVGALEETLTASESGREPLEAAAAEAESAARGRRVGAARRRGRGDAGAHRVRGAQGAGRPGPGRAPARRPARGARGGAPRPDRRPARAPAGAARGVRLGRRGPGRARVAPGGARTNAPAPRPTRPRARCATAAPRGAWPTRRRGCGARSTTSASGAPRPRSRSPAPTSGAPSWRRASTR